MALVLEKLLLINFDDLVANGLGVSNQLDLFDTGAKKDAVLQAIHDILVLPQADKIYCMDSRFPDYICRQLHIKAGLHIAVSNSDTSAGTGSVSSQTIDSFSQSNTMAKNNAKEDDWWNMTQFGTAYLNIIRDNDPKVTFMI